MQSIEDKILSNIKKCGRGTVFFAHDMLRYGQRQSVLKALERMATSGTILRVARGIYCYPKIDKVLGLGVLYPSLDEIAQAVAKRDKARIAPTGAFALNILGLSTQIQMNVVYLTDGTPFQAHCTQKSRLQEQDRYVHHICTERAGAVRGNRRTQEED